MDARADRTCRNYALALLGICLLARALLCGRFELTGDEAYYWQWSRHLDWNYYSKGPGIAVAIAAGTRLFGDSESGIRLTSVLLSGVTGWGLFTLGQMLFDARAGLRALVLATLMPLFNVGSLLMTIDPLSVCFWTWSLVVFWRVRSRPSAAGWIALGLLVGAGALAKYTNVALFVCFALFLALSPEDRPILKRAGFWLALCIALACLIPCVVWMRQHHWVTLQHIKERGALHRSLQISPRIFIQWLGEQFGVAFPFFLAGIFAVSVSHRWAENERAAARFLNCLFWPLFGFYALLGFNDIGQPNWTAPSYVAGLVMLAGGWPGWSAGRPWAQVVARGAVVLAAICCAAIAGFVVMPAPPAFVAGAISRVRGARELAAKAFEIANAEGAQFVIADHYQAASLIAYYAPGRPNVYTSTATHPRNQLDLWPGYRSGRDGQSAIYISRTKRYPEVLGSEFARVDALPSAIVSVPGLGEKSYYVYRCASLKPAESKP